MALPVLTRLYRRLVFEQRIATDVSASQNSREIGGFLQLATTAAPGHTLAELESVIVEEIARLAAEGPTDEEMERGRAQAESQFVFRMQTIGGFGGKSDHRVTLSIVPRGRTELAAADSTPTVVS